MSQDEQQSAIVEVARRCGRVAARLCREVQESMAGERTFHKDAREPVTLADYGSQAVILEAVARHFPGHRVVAEEGAEHLRGAAGPETRRRVTGLVGRALAREVEFEEVCRWIDHAGGDDRRVTWVIDPIDGTRGFLRGDQYAVAIGVLLDDEPWVGVLACPNLPVDGPASATGALFVGARGRGVVRTALDAEGEDAARVSDVASSTAVRVLGSVESAHGDPALLTALIERLSLGGGIVRMDSQAKYATVASGGAEIYLRPQSRPDYREKAWDHAAGALLVEEAGGRVTDLAGRRLDFSRGPRLRGNRGIVATNGRVHASVLGALGEILGTAG